MKTRIALILIALLCAAMANVQSARAATITVTNTNDSGAGSLRQALADANPGDTIDFAVTTPATITLTSGELLVTKSVTINGPAAGHLAVDGNAASRVFHFGAVDVTISNLTITNGVASGPDYYSNFGGGIFYDATDSGTPLTITNCTISGNSAGAGGGIADLDGALTITNSTISGNSAGSSGGGIYIDSVLCSYCPSATITNCTISDNSAPSGGAISDGYGNGSFGFTIGNTIVTGGILESGYSIEHTRSLGYNLSDGDLGAGVPTGPGDQLYTDPMLGALQDNGGPTFTQALCGSSSAIDAGDPSFTPPPDYDQRGSGFPRVVNGRIDIGAFEAPISTGCTPTPPPTPTPTPTPCGLTTIVTNTADSCTGSLRQALADANDGDTIYFAITTPATITLTSGELVVDKSVTISGPGADQLAVDGNASSRVFHISSGKTVTISGLTITNGYSPFSEGGGGIWNESGTLTINNSTISGNTALAYGGGIMNFDSNGGSAALTINNSTISGNSANQGGGISFNEPSGTLTINNSTISGNAALGDGGGILIYYGYAAQLTITNSTISGNSAPFGGSIANYGDFGRPTLQIGNTILKTGASGENIRTSGGTVTSLGYNLSSDDASAFLNATGDQNNTDPMLGPLQNNGGPTFTHALLTGSPAINAGNPAFTPPPDYDQRGPGFPRVLSCRIDIGAFESQGGTTNTYSAQVQPPINADGSSIFNVKRGVVPVKFTLSGCDGHPTCTLPAATIAVTRTAGGVIGQVNESVYSGPSDTGSNFRIDGCQYIYNLTSSALGVGTYRVDILINSQVVGSATFKLK
jgi:hypothetical protein